MKKVFVGLLFMFIFQISLAQISVGVKTLFLYVPSLDFVDEGELIDRGIYEGKIKWEIFMEVKTINSFYLEVGALKQDYKIGFITDLNVNSGLDIQGDQGYLSYQLPVLLKYKYNVNNRLGVVPKIGTVFGFSSNLNQNGSGHLETGKIIFDRTIVTDYEKQFNMFQVGLDLELKFKHSSILLGYDYVKGFKTLMKEEFSYKFKDSDIIYNGSVTGKGSYFALNLSYKYNFGKS